MEFEIAYNSMLGRVANMKQTATGYQVDDPDFVNEAQHVYGANVVIVTPGTQYIVTKPAVVLHLNDSGNVYDIENNPGLF